MQYKNSSGAVVFTQKNDRLYIVIVPSLEGHYGFPKGHIEQGESLKEAALWEIYEETGIHVQILPGFSIMDEHPIPGKEGVMKQITYFIAIYENQPIQ